MSRCLPVMDFALILPKLRADLFRMRSFTCVLYIIKNYIALFETVLPTLSPSPGSSAHYK